MITLGNIVSIKLFIFVHLINSLNIQIIIVMHVFVDLDERLSSLITVGSLAVFASVCSILSSTKNEACRIPELVETAQSLQLAVVCK